MLFGSTCKDWAIRPTRMWSVPPAEPPPHLIALGSLLKSSKSCWAVWYFESLPTAIASYSVVRRASGTVVSSLTGDLFVSIAPVITRPIVITVWPSPRFWLISSARPTVPPAPGRLTTSIDCAAIFCPWSTSCTLREVVSQPPPGAAGAMIRSVLLGKPPTVTGGPPAPPPPPGGPARGRARLGPAHRHAAPAALVARAVDAAGSVGTPPRPGVTVGFSPPHACSSVRTLPAPSTFSTVRRSNRRPIIPLTRSSLMLPTSPCYAGCR